MAWKKLRYEDDAINLSELTIDQTARVIVAMPLVLNYGRTWEIPADHHAYVVLGPDEKVQGSDTITGGGSFIGFEL